MTDTMAVRLANKEELDQVNALRKQVYDLHALGEPSIFNEYFSNDLRDYVYTIWNDPEQDIIVSEREGRIVGFAILHHFHMPVSFFMKERYYLYIEEFCVDESWRRCGVATELIAYVRDYALAHGIHRVELSVWTFNDAAIKLYEAMGFKTIRKYMNLIV